MRNVTAVPISVAKLIDNHARLIEERDRLLVEKTDLRNALTELELRTRQYLEGTLVTFPAALLPQVRSLIDIL